MPIIIPMNKKRGLIIKPSDQPIPIDNYSFDIYDDFNKKSTRVYYYNMTWEEVDKIMSDLRKLGYQIRNLVIKEKGEGA